MIECILYRVRQRMLHSTSEELYRPSDVDPARFPYYGRTEDDLLLGVLINILKKNGNHWDMPREPFEQIIAEIGQVARSGGIMLFIGAASLERISTLGALDVGEDEVRLRGEIVRFQVGHNLRLLPSLKRAIHQRLASPKSK